MGQADYLKVILGILITGLAILVGAQLFRSGEIDSDIQAITHEQQQIVAAAAHYYIAPTFRGGGGRSFNGFKVSSKLSSTIDAKFQIVGAGNSLSITGISNKNYGNTLTFTYDASQSMWWKHPTIQATGDFD